MAHSLPPTEAWQLVERGEARILDLRTATERRRYGAPPGLEPVSLANHGAPAGMLPETIYLCRHAVRSKLTQRRGAAEIEGGFVAWREAGLPIEHAQ